MLPDTLSVLETLSLIYEDLDINNVEEKFIDLVDEAFDFDRIALFFVKHKKNILQGKLGKGFDHKTITELAFPLDTGSLLSSPLANGFPVQAEEKDRNDPLVTRLGIENYVLIPVVNKKRVVCWEVKNCTRTECPVYGKRWTRCWLVADTKCCDGDVKPEDKPAICANCQIFTDQDMETMEGVLLVDNSISREPIRREAITALSIIAHAVGRAINNSKLYTKTLNEAIKDSLTGIHNRRYFDERFLDEIDRAKRYGESLSLVVCDIDRFKQVNDTFGHQVGDMVLTQLADILKKNRRKSDVVARYGGDEFAMLLLNTDKDEAVSVAEKLRQEIERAVFKAYDVDLKITISFGVASFDEQNDTFNSLMSKADKFLYAAKDHGRNRVCSA